MDISRATGSELTALPEYIINNFLPGARPLLSRYPRLFKVIGVVLALWYFGPLARLQSIWYQFQQYLVATITIASEEDLYSYVVSWLAEQNTLQTDHTLAASTETSGGDFNKQLHRQYRRMGREMDIEDPTRKPEDSKVKYDQSGAQFFYYKRRLFYANRTLGDGYTYMGNRHRRAEILKLSCLGRSTQPIKDFIEDIFEANKNKEKSMTIIRRPFRGGYSSSLGWSRLTSKPRRNLDTVILDNHEKQRVIKDIEEYMDESIKAFYADHGIPCRRGYLFHGVPGTGKTSFCLALAAKFNLDVYVLTLLDQDMQDSDLLSLINQMPTPSMLLLEDIDTAGLSRKKSAPSSGLGVLRKFGRPSKHAIKMMPELVAAAEPKLESDDEDLPEKATNVSLSGLLNAIDGVGSPEGIITIMTTNKPDELDEALVRAGRISVRVAFRKASQEQAEEMFLRMYVERPQAGITLCKEVQDSGQAQNVRELAKKFAQQLYKDTFSPADLQDYLLLHKKDPQGAVDKQEAWMTEMSVEKERKVEEKELEIQAKAEKAALRRQQLRDTLKSVMTGDEATESKETAEKPADARTVAAQLEEAEAEIAAEDRARP